MLTFHDTASEDGARKEARMDQRTTRHVKATIQKAAALVGVQESAFVSTSAYDRACSVIAASETFALKARDRDAFLAAFDAEPTPSPALGDDFKLMKTMLDHGE